jgi:hypothetical protein
MRWSINSAGDLLASDEEVLFGGRFVAVEGILDAGMNCSQVVRQLQGAACLTERQVRQHFCGVGERERRIC